MAAARSTSARLTVMVVGGGGREHALAQKLAESPRVARVLVAPGNGGTARLARAPDIDFGRSKIENVEVRVADHEQVIEKARQHHVGLVVIGPEDPLAEGLADDLTAAGIPTFGPSKGAAQLEVSKAFSKQFMARHDIPTARFGTFTDFDAACAFVHAADFRVVVKASGLAAGKGVLLPETKEETIAAVRQVMVDKAFGSAGNEVVLEEFLEGEEVSLLAFCDGTRCVCMPAAQDHKRALDGDQGLNTGGMGAYAPAPALTPELRTQAEAMMQKTVTQMAAEGNPYQGVLYAGFMLSPAGPKILEFNCRFGDPETQVLLPLLENDLADLMKACVRGGLAECRVMWRTGAAAAVVCAAPGYPGKYPKGMVISGLAEADAEPGVALYHAGTKAHGADVVTSGGRVLAVTGVGRDLQQALDTAYRGVGKVAFDGMFHRSDIGWRGLALLRKGRGLTRPASRGNGTSGSTGSAAAEDHAPAPTPDEGSGSSEQPPAKKQKLSE